MARLELEAAKTGALLMKGLNKVLNIEDVRMWSDSMNVLGWLRTSSKDLKMYVSNRVDTIRNVTNPEQWEYVNTKENPADIGSRGATVEQLVQDPLWRNGPRFLELPEEEWPSSKKKAELIELDDEGTSELKKETQAFMIQTKNGKYVSESGLIDWESYSVWSSYLKLARVMIGGTRR